MTQSEAVLSALPVELTHFVGRERELDALRSLAATARLLTLTGAGGSGKSRLALELIPHSARPDEELIAWVELAPLHDPALVPGAVLRALGAPTEGGSSTLDNVIGTVRSRTVTIVLDNCEHLVESCAALADALLRACPNLRMVATSREALGIAGERAWLVPPLALPSPDAPIDALLESDAVRLFLDRARDVQPDFALTPRNARLIGAICARLDGIPLAIELAAARVRHMSPEQIHERLSDAFALLTTGARTALPRHRTLRATLDWSHDLLPESARVVLRRLSVFRGGFTLDMVERVAAGDSVAPDDVLDLIATLADRSLIVVREQDAMARYHLLETMRQYAQLRLDEAGEDAAVRRRLADAVTDLVADAEPYFTTRERLPAFRRLDAELDNIREVLSWTRTHDEQQHVRLVGMLWWFWFSTRHWVEAHGWISGALELNAAEAPTRERAALLFAFGALECLRADMALARPRLEEALELAALLGEEKLEAYALNYMAMSYAASLSPDAADYAGRAERWLRANGDDYGLRLSLLLGGMALHGAGRNDEACAKMEEAVAIARSFGQDRELAIALQTYATVLLGRGDIEKGRQLVLESLQALRGDPSYLFIARAIDYFALLNAHTDVSAAARALGVGEALRRHIAAARFEHDQRRIDELIERLRIELGPAAYERHFEHGLAVQPSDAVDEVMRLAVHADAPARSAEPAPATREAQMPTVAPESRAHTVNAPSDVDLAVRLLGTVDAIVGGSRVEQWPYTKPKELLAYLLLHPQGGTRIDIGAALWPDAAPSQVRNSFHVTMHHLRKTLGHAEWIALEGERYRIAPHVTLWVDAVEFEQRAGAVLGRNAGSLTVEERIVQLRATMSLYRDHLLAGETVGSWRDELQDRLRRRHCDLGITLGTLLDESGDVHGAVKAYETIVACEPLHEEAHRGLLLALTRAGKRAQALRHFERLKALLEEVELEPEPETEELFERIRTADIVPH